MNIRKRSRFVRWLAGAHVAAGALALAAGLGLLATSLWSAAADVDCVVVAAALIATGLVLTASGQLVPVLLRIEESSRRTAELLAGVQRGADDRD